MGLLASLMGLIEATSNRLSGSTGGPDAVANCCAAAMTGTIAIAKTASLCARILLL
jgi:hypothetical protein